MKTKLLLAMCFIGGLLASTSLAEDYYVSAARGKGKKASKESPAKDLGNIVNKLKPGDTIHIAEGTYTGRGDCGTVIIEVPVNVIGGYSDDFSSRDPWGQHKSVLSGVNKSENWKRMPALMIDLMKYKGKEMPSITVDGIIVDHAQRNRYSAEDQLTIVRSANPKTKENPTPDQGGLVIRVSKTGNYDDVWKITVQNCVVMNTAPSQGALSVSGYKGSKVNIQNNLVINNTGTGILCGTKYASRDEEGRPEFTVTNNTVLFTWKFDPPAQSYSGNSIKFDAGIVSVVNNNVLAFADRFGVHNAAKANVLLADNILMANVEGDYLEFDTNISLDDMEDEAEYLHEDTRNNVKAEIKIPISKEWATHYGTRVLVDRNAAEADIKAQQTTANEIRSILGLPLQAGTVDGPTSPVWLPRMSINDAIQAGAKQYMNDKGCKIPNAK